MVLIYFCFFRTFFCGHVVLKFHKVREVKSKGIAQMMHGMSGTREAPPAYGPASAFPWSFNVALNMQVRVLV